MAQSSKLLAAHADLNDSSYTAYIDSSGSTWLSASYGSLKTADFTFAFAEMGIPAGSIINWVHIRVESWEPTPLHGTNLRRFGINGTEVPASANIVAGNEYDITGNSGWGTNAVQIRFRSGTSGTYFPSAPVQGTASRTNSSNLGWNNVIVTVDYTLPYSACVPPSSTNLSGSLTEGDITLSYSGAAGGTNNGLSSIGVQCAESSDNIAWGAWADYGTISTSAGSGSFAVSPSGTRGKYRKFRIRAQGSAGESYYSGWVDVPGSVKRDSLPNAPSALGFNIANTSYFYNSLQCKWTNNGDPDGNFSGVHIRLARYNHDPAYGAVGWAWLDTGWIWIGNVASITYTRAQLIAKGAKSGDALGFGLVSQDAFGVQNWDASGLPASGYVYLAADPAAPDTFSASPAIQESGVTLAWSGANGGGIAISGYDIEYKTASTAAGVDGTDGFATADGSPVATSGASGNKSDLSNITRGYFERWRIRTITSEGTKSAWKYSNTIQKNRAPVIPVILFPVTGRTTYNAQPYVGLSIGAEPDGQTQTLYCSIDGGATQNAGAMTAGTKKMRLPTLTIGNHTIKFWLQDSLGAASGEATVTITIAENTYTRTITGYVSDQQLGTLLWDETNALRTSEEILELKGRVNQIRVYYGLTAVSLPYEATTGTNTIKHFHTWIPNFAALYQGLADTGTISGSSVPARVIKDRNAPSAAVVNQIRTMIGSL